MLRLAFANALFERGRGHDILVVLSSTSCYLNDKMLEVQRHSPISNLKFLDLLEVFDIARDKDQGVLDSDSCNP